MYPPSTNESENSSKQQLPITPTTMDDLVNSIKKRLSVDNLVEMMKDANVIDGEKDEQNVRKNLENVNPDELINAKDLATKLNSLTAKGLPTSEMLDAKRTRELEQNLDFQRTKKDLTLPQGQGTSNTVVEVESESSEPEKHYIEKPTEEDDYFRSFLN